MPFDVFVREHHNRGVSHINTFWCERECLSPTINPTNANTISVTAERIGRLGSDLRTVFPQIVQRKFQQNFCEKLVTKTFEPSHTVKKVILHRSGKKLTFGFDAERIEKN